MGHKPDQPVTDASHRVPGPMLGTGDRLSTKKDQVLSSESSELGVGDKPGW